MNSNLRIQDPYYLDPGMRLDLARNAKSILRLPVLSFSLPAEEKRKCRPNQLRIGGIDVRL